MTIQELINNSGDSYLKEYVYTRGEAILNLDLDELDKEVQLSVKSNLMAIDVPESTDLPFRTCFLELTKLSEVLGLENGIYVPPSDFGKLMKDKRENLNLAYGLRASEYNYILSLNTSSKLASFVIQNLDDIKIE